MEYGVAAVAGVVAGTIAAAVLPRCCSRGRASAGQEHSGSDAPTTTRVSIRGVAVALPYNARVVLQRDVQGASIVQFALRIQTAWPPVVDMVVEDRLPGARAPDGIDAATVVLTRHWVTIRARRDDEHKSGNTLALALLRSVQEEPSRAVVAVASSSATATIAVNAITAVSIQAGEDAASELSAPPGLVSCQLKAIDGSAVAARLGDVPASRGWGSAVLHAQSFCDGWAWRRSAAGLQAIGATETWWAHVAPRGLCNCARASFLLTAAPVVAVSWPWHPPRSRTASAVLRTVHVDVDLLRVGMGSCISAHVDGDRVVTVVNSHTGRTVRLRSVRSSSARDEIEALAQEAGKAAVWKDGAALVVEVMQDQFVAMAALSVGSEALLVESQPVSEQAAAIRCARQLLATGMN